MIQTIQRMQRICNVYTLPISRLYEIIYIYDIDMRINSPYQAVFCAENATYTYALYIHVI